MEPTPRNLFRFTDGAKADIKALGLAHTFSDLVGKIKEGNEVDHCAGNIQNGDFIFQVKENMVIGITLVRLDGYARHFTFHCDVCLDSKKITVGDLCELCEGEGCEDCKEGLVFKIISCPACVNQKIEDSSNEWQNRNRIERDQSHGIGRPIPGKTRRNKRRKAGSRNHNGSKRGSRYT